MARFFLPKENIHDRRGIVRGDELGHLRKVLRLRPGDALTVFDESGWEHAAVIRALGADCAEIEIEKSYLPRRESPLRVALGLGLTKGDKMDLVIEKATELGVDSIAPVITEFTVPALDEKKAARRFERWQKIALSASKQSGRTRVPEIRPLGRLSDFLEQAGDDALKLILWEKESERALHEIKARQPRVGGVTILVGPEGGFSPAEASAAARHGFLSVRVGPRILRAETAPIAILALVQFLWGDLG